MTLPSGDEPIAASEDDLLGRGRLAQVLADEISSLDVRQGAVVAITGPWGSGKTSLMNMAAAQLRSDPQVLGVVEFNPWLFSGAEQLAENLLAELATQLQDQESRTDRARRLATTVTDTLLTYSRGLSILRAVPVVGPVAEAADKGLEGANALLRGDQSLQRRRQDATTALAELDRRVIVLVDDIDRLTRTETRDLFRTVRLSASFPNVVYLLCLDHKVVAGALDEDGFSGKAYLEKILTVTCRVPELADHQIGHLFTDGLNAILEQHATGPDDEAMWSQAYHDIIRPLFTTMRDAKRVLASLPITLRLVRDELPVVDVVVLECLRTLYPDLHAAIDVHADALTQPFSHHQNADEVHLTAQIKSFVARDDRFGGRLASAVVGTLFPNGARRLSDGHNWLTFDRSAVAGVGSSAGLRFYLTHELLPGVAPAGAVRSVVDALGNETTLRDAFNRIPDDQIEDVLERLLEPARSIVSDRVNASVRVLLELFPRLRIGRSGMLDFGSHFSVTRPVLQMLRRLPSEAVAGLASELVKETPTIYGAFELVSLVGHWEHAGHQLVSEEQSQELKSRLRERIADAGGDLAGERDLAIVLFRTYRPSGGQLVLPKLMSPPVAETVLKTAVAVTQSQGMGGGPSLVSRSYSLHWETLTALYGSEENIRTIADLLRTASAPADDPALEQALDLVDQYLHGWRPPNPFAASDAD